MWEGGGLHGSHEALLLQAAAGSGAGDVHGHAPAALLPWLGSAAAPSYSYMAPPSHAPPPGLLFGPDAAAGTTPFGFGVGGGAGGMGLFGGLQDPSSLSQHHGMVGGGAGPSTRVVSGLLGTLQAELGRMTAKEIMDAKALAASRSHSEAERRRRQRINGHLAKLRSLLPNTTKTDKASLLAEVIEHVKELKRQTSAVLERDAQQGEEDGSSSSSFQQQQHLFQLLPTESDELIVEAAEVADGGRLLVRASLCCEDRAGLIPDIARALAALRLRARRAEIATLGGRVRNVLLITTAADDGADEDDEEGDDDDVDGEDGCAGGSTHRRHELVAAVQEALRGVMDRKAAASGGGDTSSSSGGGSGMSLKRQRMSGGAAHDQGSL
ncbi:hypothetical protein PR202_gb03110 [Eleusine coracana subsp. coracana]|uniref:BHLH domain-containing protein n=1 Tax=Eleusine coracana subsp. coracana TaxID=191504 RepID=A0AAV5E106_ELECO|nr:hypothetical protein QOZ80_8BG0660720 [Eleusine coracana subsp. coracana]GJN16152.1 hypothetical protein PR202_gb03110 [Eleusine coracana subsp. coracana]